jgi:hypothetical protein
MASIKKDIRTNQALLVIQQSNKGMSIIEACQEVGISRSTFYYFISHNPDAIASFQEMQLVAATQQFALILDNQFEILESVIEDALADTTKPRQRLAIYKHLNKRMDELSERVQSHNPNRSSDGDFLTGPLLTQGISSFQDFEQSAPEMDIQEG